MSFASAYGFLTKPAPPWQTPFGDTLVRGACQNPRLRQETPAMDIERINQIGANLADLTRRTEALRGYL